MCERASLHFITPISEPGSQVAKQSNKLHHEQAQQHKEVTDQTSMADGSKATRNQEDQLSHSLITHVSEEPRYRADVQLTG